MKVAALDPDDVDLFGSLGDTTVLDAGRLGPTLFCHGSPRRGAVEQEEAG